MPGSVLRCAATGADAFAYVQQSFTATDEIWVTVSVYFDTAALAVWNANFAEILDIRISTGAKRALLGIDAPPEWYLINGLGSNDTAATAPTAGAWHTLELHWNRNVACDFYLNSSLEASITAVNNQADQVFIGLVDTAIDAASILYVDTVRIGTSRGGTEIFSEDFEGGTPIANFTFSDGDVTVVADPATPPPAAIEGVSIAFDDPALEPDPTWTRIDSDIRVASFSIDRGRSFEIDRTDTGRATVAINDVDGDLDPTNASGPYYGKIEPLLQIALALHNPVTDTWTTLYRGFIEDYDYEEAPSQVVNRLTISCVDAFEILTAIEMLPDGTFGDTPDSQSQGDIVFEAANVDDRIFQALGNAGWPAGLATVFSGNVSVQRTVYSTGQSILEVIQEAADAEFPGVANVYVSKIGKVTFHGRLAKFDPVTVAAGAGGAWDFQHWKCGDGAAVVASPTDTAQIRGLSFTRGLSKIINSAIATPKGIKQKDIATQTATDPTSIGIYGIRSWSAPDLITEGGLNDSLNANDETQLFAQYYVDNYAEPRNRISRLVFKAMQPDDARAAANWELLCGAEISDLIDVTVTHPGGGGFSAEPFFIEGIHYEVTRANPDYHMVTLTLDVSPQAYFTSSPFTGDT